MALAPMADVTDVAFREMFSMYGKPDVMFTEFVSTDGLCSSGRKNLMRELQYTPKQRPIVAQIWGNKPENFYKTALLLKKLKFDGIDINMGCPQRKEIAQGTCVALIKKPDLAKKIIKEIMRGAGKLPVSVKTRIGFDKIETVKWVGHLLETKPAAIILHARTKKEMSKAPAHWEEIAKAVELRDELKSKTLILGNGDVWDLADARAKAQETGADGVMLGRSAFGNPWLFKKRIKEITIEEKLKVLLEHVKLYEKFFGSAIATPRQKILAPLHGQERTHKNFAAMRKYFKAYASGFEGARELRADLMRSEDGNQTRKVIGSFLKK